jgi:hypothetical protein
LSSKAGVLLVLALLAAVGVSLAALRLADGDTEAGTSPPEASERDAAALRALVDFARSPSDSTWSALPLADRVELGLGSELARHASPGQLRDPRAWTLDAQLFRGAAGPFSALDLLARGSGRLEYAVGPHPHCASPPRPPPAAVAALRRLSAQPRDRSSCLQWWTVDVFVTASGAIRAVTLDVWEP